MLLAVLAEIAALRHLPITFVYLTILGLEALMVLTAIAFFGQALGSREIAGTALVLAGTALLATQDG